MLIWHWFLWSYLIVYYSIIQNLCSCFLPNLNKLLSLFLTLPGAGRAASSNPFLRPLPREFLKKNTGFYALFDCNCLNKKLCAFLKKNAQFFSFVWMRPKLQHLMPDDMYKKLTKLNFDRLSTFVPKFRKTRVSCYVV